MNSTEHKRFAITVCALARRLCQATVLFCFATTTGIAFAQINLPQSGYISTIAGTGGTFRYAGDGGPATSAQLNGPRGVTVDASGNVYIADYGNHVIRKVTASTGVITTIAGTGTGGHSGDGGPATSAQLSLPQSVAIDASGNIYIAELGNQDIRKVTASTGVISTIAGNGTAGYTGDGGQATNAELNDPRAVAVDASGNVYIADSGNDVIRKVTASTGVISTYAGGPNASCYNNCVATNAVIGYAYGVAVDASGNVYISDLWGGLVDEVTASTGIFTRIAGDGNSGFFGDGGQALSAQLNGPQAAAVDAHGNVYIDDSGNERIREVMAATGVINTIAGNGTLGYAGDGGPANASDVEINYPYDVAVDANGNVYIADTGNSVIRVVGGSTNTPTISVATSGTPSVYGAAVTFTATVTSGDTNQVTFLSGSTSLGTATPSSGGTATLTTSSLSLGSNSITASIAAGGSYSAATSSAITQTVNQAAPTISAWPTAGTITFGQTLASSTLTGGTASVSGTFAWTTSSTAPNAGTPSESVKFTPTNTTDYTTVSGTVSVTVYQATPTISVSSSGSPSAYGNSVTFTATVTNGDTNTVTFYNGSTSLGVATPVSGTAPLSINNLPAGSNSITAEIAAGGNYAAATSYAITQTVNQPTAGIINTFAGTGGSCGYTGDGGAATSARLCGPRGAAVDASGNLYIADYGNHVIRKVTASTGIISTIAGTGTQGHLGDGEQATSAQLSLPTAVAIDSSGNIYIAESGNQDIRKVTASTGVISTIAGNGTAGYTGDGGPATGAELNNPRDLAVDASGNIYVTDSGNFAVRKVTSSGIISTYEGGPNANCYNNCSAGSGVLNYPWGVAVDASGNVYITDYWGGSIVEVTASTWIMTDIAGTGTSGYSGDGGPALSAQLYYPVGVKVDAHGNVYVVDQNNDRIREITASTGVINTIAGNGTVGYAGDGGPANATDVEVSYPFDLAVDASGNVYIADTGNNVIRVVGGSATTPAISVATSGTPSVYGTAVTFTATVTSGDTNAVTFYSGGTSLGTATPSSGTATLTTSSLPVGSDSITASIAAGGGYGAATSNAITQMVNGTSSADTGTVTLLVNGSSIAQTSYGAGSTPSSITENLAAAASSSLVYVSAVDNALYIESTSSDAGNAYPYSVVISDTAGFNPASFSASPSGGNLQGATGGSGPIYTYSASYDGVGNITGYSDSVMGTWSMVNGYDSLNRLTMAQNTATTSTSGQYAGKYLCWSYDSFGNRTAQQLQTSACSSGVTATASYNSNNHVTWTTVNAAVNGFSYDAAGDVQNDNKNTYLYDGEGRICAVMSTPVAGFTTMTGYIYDADGTRVAKGTITSMSCDPAINGFQTTSDYVLGPSGEQVTEVGMDANGNMAHQHTNVWAGGKLLATYDDNGLHFYLDDPLGTRRVQTDYAGVVEQSCTSLPYGDGESCAATPTEHLFTGKERDAESGNDYFKYRYYASSMGRWLSPDPSGLTHVNLAYPQELNLYNYVGNNPLTRIDLDGLCWKGFQWACNIIQRFENRFAGYGFQTDDQIALHPNQRSQNKIHQNYIKETLGAGDRPEGKPLPLGREDFCLGPGCDLLYEQYLESLKRRPNPNITVATDLAGVIAPLAGKAGKVLGPVASVVNFANDPSLKSGVENGLPILWPESGVPILIYGLADDGSEFAADTITNVFTPDASQSDTINANGVTMPDPQSEFDQGQAFGPN